MDDLILVVEDDFDVRESIRDALEDEGYAVASVADGLEALTYLRGHPPPSLILLDWMMPRCDGAQFLRLRGGDSSLASIPVLLLTADIQKADKGELLTTGALLTKPVMLPELLAAVERFRRPSVPPAGPV
jgi:CheY-like chemotaxis protein